MVLVVLPNQTHEQLEPVRHGVVSHEGNQEHEDDGRIKVLVDSKVFGMHPVWHDRVDGHPRQAEQGVPDEIGLA
eukprot:12911289-Alexandrium_andersonii.AAC.1